MSSLSPRISHFPPLLLLLLGLLQMNNQKGFSQQPRPFQPLSFPAASLSLQQRPNDKQPLPVQNLPPPTFRPLVPQAAPGPGSFHPLNPPTHSFPTPGAAHASSTQNPVRTGFPAARPPVPSNGQQFPTSLYSAPSSNTSTSPSHPTFQPHNTHVTSVSPFPSSNTSYAPQQSQSMYVASPAPVAVLSTPALSLPQQPSEVLTLAKMNTLMIQMDKEMTYLDAARQQHGSGRLSTLHPRSGRSDNTDSMAALECGEISLHSEFSELQSRCARCEELAQQIITMCATTRQSSTNLDTVVLTKMRGLEALARDALRLVDTIRKSEQEKNRQKEIREKLFETSATQQVLNRDGEAGLASLSREHEHLSAGLRTITDTIAAATSSLGSLQRQHQLLKGVQRKVLDVATSLGMSRRVLQWIDRQETINTIIAFGGMMVVLIIVMFFYYWWSSPAVSSS